MQLADYLLKNELTDTEFARKIKADRTTVSRLRRGETLPGWEMLRQIRRATQGAVTPNDFLDCR